MTHAGCSRPDSDWPLGAVGAAEISGTKTLVDINIVLPGQRSCYVRYALRLVLCEAAPTLAEPRIAASCKGEFNLTVLAPSGRRVLPIAGEHQHKLYPD